MGRFLRKLLAPFAWRHHHSRGANDYYANSLTGDRKVIGRLEGYSPVDWKWLNAAEDKSQ